jgi:hypothetical protein
MWVPLSLKSCWLAGVMDTAFPVPGGEHDVLEREHAPAATGVLTVMGSFQVDRIIAGLRAVTVETQTTGALTPETITTRFALAQPYRLDRLRSAVTVQRSDAAFEPIRVAKINHPDLEEVVVVLGGVHRTYAARQAGRETLPAIVEEVWTVDPTAFSIIGRRLLRHAPGDAATLSREVLARAPELPVDLCHLLAFFGTVIYPAMPNMA